MNKKHYEIYKKWRKGKYKRDLEKLQNDLANKGQASSGIRIKEEKWLKSELDADLERKKQEVIEYEREKEERSRTRKTQRVTNWALVLVAISSIAISSTVAFVVPWRQGVSENHSEIQAVYKNLVTNQDIFISNANGTKDIEAGGGISNLPESFFVDEIGKKARRIIQDKFGLVQYRFFLYYLQQTTLLNDEIVQMRDYFVVTDASSLRRLNPTRKYLATMNFLQKDGSATKFNYQKDTECLQHFFEHNFDFLTIDGRGRSPGCDDETLSERLVYHFGYLPDDTPSLLSKQLQEVLNQK